MAQTQSPEGIGIEATGGILAVAPTPDATAAVPAPGNVATVTIPTVLNANVVSAAVTGNTTTAGVASLTAPVALLPLLPALGITAGAISSSCTALADGTFTRTSNLVDLAIAGLTIPVNPAANTVLTLPGVLTVTLNQHIAGPTAGSRTVNALVITLLGATGLGETITVGSSTCGPFVAGAPVASGKGLALGLGAVGAAGASIAVVTWNRRRRTTAGA